MSSAVMDAIDLTAKLGLTSLLTWAVASLAQRKKDKRAEIHTAAAAEMGVIQHNDKLLMEMFKIVQAEAAALRLDIALLRPLELHRPRLCEALEHIQAWAFAKDIKELADARRRALAFYKRCTNADPTLMNTPANMVEILKELDT